MTRTVGYESSKSFARREAAGFWRAFAHPPILDVGFRGGTPDAQPILPGAIGLELDEPGYDGLHVPDRFGYFNTVHASHVLEHLPDPIASLREWFRVLNPGGHLILMVPSAFLYERRLTVPPSRWSPEHVRSCTPASLLFLVEHALTPNTYRVRHLADNDVGYDYNLPIDVHPVGALEIECVIQKITPPAWSVEP